MNNLSGSFPSDECKMHSLDQNLSCLQHDKNSPGSRQEYFSSLNVEKELIFAKSNSERNIGLLSQYNQNSDPLMDLFQEVKQDQEEEPLQDDAQWVYNFLKIQDNQQFQVGQQNQEDQQIIDDQKIQEEVKQSYEEQAQIEVTQPATQNLNQQMINFLHKFNDVDDIIQALSIAKKQDFTQSRFLNLKSSVTPVGILNELNQILMQYGKPDLDKTYFNNLIYTKDKSLYELRSLTVLYFFIFGLNYFQNNKKYNNQKWSFVCFCGKPSFAASGFKKHQSRHHQYIDIYYLKLMIDKATGRPIQGSVTQYYTLEKEIDIIESYLIQQDRISEQQLSQKYSFYQNM